LFIILIVLFRAASAGSDNSIEWAASGDEDGSPSKAIMHKKNASHVSSAKIDSKAGDKDSHKPSLSPKKFSVVASKKPVEEIGLDNIMNGRTTRCV